MATLGIKGLTSRGGEGISVSVIVAVVWTVCLWAGSTRRLSTAGRGRHIDHATPVPRRRRGERSTGGLRHGIDIQLRGGAITADHWATETRGCDTESHDATQFIAADHHQTTTSGELFRNSNSLKYNLLFIIVDVSTEAFVGTVCLIAVRRSVSGRTGCRRCERIGKTPHRCSSTCLAPSWYDERQLDRPFRRRLQSMPKHEQW